MSVDDDSARRFLDRVDSILARLQVRSDELEAEIWRAEHPILAWRERRALQRLTKEHR
jgi:hypothetical protein